MWANKSATGEILHRQIESAGITHIIANFGELARRKMLPQTTPDGLRSLNDFWNRYTLRIYGTRDSDRWVGVYRILSPTEAASAHPVDRVFQGFIK
jgi:hypothetical protein